MIAELFVKLGKDLPRNRWHKIEATLTPDPDGPIELGGVRYGVADWKIEEAPEK